MPRVLAAMVFAPALLGLLWVGGVPLGLACAVLALLMQYEVTRMALARAPRQLLLASWGMSLAVVAALTLGLPDEAMVPASTGIVLLFLLAALAAPGPITARTSMAAMALVLTLYASALMPLLYLLRLRPHDGRELATLAAFIPWAADTGAYFAGRAFGRRKLAPNISPAKTWEGALGGLVTACAFCAAWGWLLGATTPTIHWFALSILATGMGMLGDLVESLLKRSFGTKDSSNIIPGHGGILDRFDSVLFATWAVYAYSSLFLPVAK